ncbi:hypothetical protein [Cyclobacterium xiamenense]|uniref:hypothetical protein n=1 Tax=Cyclobacterium xiamenense TaxID=1297121 RepID=UPI0035CFB4CF
MKNQSNQKSSKKSIVFTLTFFTMISTSVVAQTAQTEVEIIQEAFGLEKKIAVANFMNLEESALNFWTIYDEYEGKRKKLGKERIQIISEYADSYPNISDEMIQELFNRTQSIKKSFAKLQKTYFTKMKKEVGINKAAQFWQLEGYFNSIIQADIYTQIPFIGENLSGQ